MIEKFQIPRIDTRHSVNPLLNSLSKPRVEKTDWKFGFNDYPPAFIPISYQIGDKTITTSVTGYTIPELKTRLEGLVEDNVITSFSIKK